MSYNQTLQQHNSNIRELINTANNLPAAVLLQEKTIDIAENGSVEIMPDSGYALSKVTANVSVAGSGGTNNDTFIRLYETGILGDTEITSLPNTFCRGWIYLKGIDFPNVATMGTYVCYQCTALEEVNLPNLTTIGNYSFYNCTSLLELDFPKVTSVGQNALRQCTSATSVNLPECVTLNSYAFQKCEALTKLDFPKVNWLGAQVFNGCSALTALIFRVNEVCTMSNANNIFASTPIASGTGYVYVPATLVESYKSATNWSAYASQIRAIEDYPDICG
jgi:hypothetical protein